LENTDCTLIVDNYDGDYIKLSVTVESNVSENILSQLFKVGRYNISVKNGVISFDRIKKTIFINGIELNETIIVNVSLPYGITLSNQLLN
jgi:hypothetical protein